MKTHATHKMSGMISKSLEPSEVETQFNSSEFQNQLSDMIFRAMGGEDVLKECEGHEFLTGLLMDVVEHAMQGNDSAEIRACVSKKIPILMDEGYKQKQAIAIAFKTCRENSGVAEKGKEVPRSQKMTDENLRAMGRDRLSSVDGTKIPSISNTREVNLSVTEDQGLAATFLPSYARKVASPGREVKEIEKADRISKEGDTKSPFVVTVPVDKEGSSEGAKKGWDTRRAGGEGGGYVTPGMPIKGHPYHEKTEAQLKYIIQDASEAAQNMRGHDPKAEGKYLDQVNDAHTVLAYRKRQGISGPLKLPTDDPKTYEVIHRPGGKGTFGEVKRVTIPPRDDEPSKTLAQRAADIIFNAVSKVGTTEGTKRGWETRRGAAPVEEEKPRQSAEGILAQAVREAMQDNLTESQQKPPEQPQTHRAVPLKEPGEPGEVRYRAEPSRGISYEEAEKRPKRAYDPNDPLGDIDIGDIKPLNIDEWEEDSRKNEARLRAKEEEAAAAREADEKKQSRDWNQKMRSAQRSGDLKAVEQLRSQMPERIKMQRKALMDKVLEVLERHGISKAGTSEGAKLGWESRQRGDKISDESKWTYMKKITQDRASRANERIGRANGETTEEKITNYVSDESTANMNHEELKQRLLDLAALGLERNHPAVQRMIAKV